MKFKNIPNQNPNSPKYRLLVLLLLVPALLIAAVIGVFVFAIVLGLVILAASVIMLRFWWLRRKLRKAGGSKVLEGEYEVIRRRDPPTGK